MSIATGSRLGPYEILAPIGAGGMGEVWKARDARLERLVAVKVLPDDFFGDGERRARFEREAKLLAALSHPNVAAVYSFEEISGRHLLTQELLEGETLRSALSGAKLSTRKALDWALQVAHGLAAAHEKGIVHRDLKPENLFVTRDGRLKILDFGLAKLTEAEVSPGGTNLPTETRGTEPGVVLGTLGYMAPEQLKGRPADARSDIFSFGAILYEMLTGKRAFCRETAAETISAILKEDPPDISVTNQTVPPGLERLVSHCLEKSPEQRFHSAHDLAFGLESLAGASGSSARTVPAVGAGLRRRIAWPIAAALAAATLAAGVFAGRTLFKRAVPPLRFTRLTFRRGLVQSARFAPDGDTVVYGAAWDGAPFEVFRTGSDGRESRALGLGPADLLAVSRSGDLALSLGRRFTAGWESTGTLAQVPLEGAAPREVLENVQEADWAPDGKSLLVVREVAGRYRLEFPIGKVLYESKGWISNPRLSPRGDRIAFNDHPLRGDNVGSTCVVDLSGKKTTWFSQGAATGLAWSPDGKELWGSASGALGATSRPEAFRLLAQGAADAYLLDVSPGGRALVAYASIRREMFGLAPGETVERNLSFFDWSVPRDLSSDGRTALFYEARRLSDAGYGVCLRKTDGSPPVQLGEGMAVALSPDGRWVLSILHPFGKTQLMLLPTGAGAPRTLPEDEIHYEGWGVWMPDGKRVVVAGTEEGHAARLYLRDVEGGHARPVTPEGIQLNQSVVSSDGTLLAAADTEGRVVLYPIQGGDPRPLPGLEPGEAPIRWSSDPNVVFVSRRDERPAKVFRLDVTTGKRELWRQLAPLDPAGVSFIDNVHISADGRAYVYSCRRLLSDLYVVDGLK